MCLAAISAAHPCLECNKVRIFNELLYKIRSLVPPSIQITPFKYENNKEHEIDTVVINKSEYFFIQFEIIHRLAPLYVMIEYGNKPL